MTLGGPEPDSSAPRAINHRRHARADGSASAGDVQRVAGDVGGLVAGQEERSGGHLVHRAEAAEWRHPARASLDRGIEALQIPSRALGVNRSRRNGIDRDVVLGELQSHVSNEPVNAGLGGRVGGAALIVTSTACPPVPQTTCR